MKLYQIHTAPSIRVFTQLMGKSRDWDELQYTWTEWRRKSGRDMRDLYEQMAELTNEAARYNSRGFFFKCFELKCP